MWPGICRVHHAALLQLRGDWDAAEREARQACAELDGFHVPNVAAGYVEIGEIRRRLGDLDGAEEAFAMAEELCGQQSAGLALVRLAQRRVDAATAIITRMLAEQTWNQLARGKLLPARVQIAVAAGDLDAAAAGGRRARAHRGRLRQPGPVGRRPVLPGPLAAGAGGRQRSLRHAARGPGAVAASSRCPTRWPPRACCSAKPAAAAVTTTAPPVRSPARRRSSIAWAPPSTPVTSATSRRHPRRCPLGSPAREAEVLALVASGQTNKEMAATLHLSERTVARHLSNIFTKVGVTSRTAAAAFAYENDLASPPR